MPMRKLTPRSETGELCGDPNAVSGAAPAESEENWDAARQEGGDGDGGDPPYLQVVDAVLEGVKGDSAAGERPSPTVYSPTRLQRAASEVIAELHAAKQEIAKELEANLKQLKAVLKETQKIAKDMEAVLREAQAKPPEEEKATGDKSGGKQKQDAWEPPTLKKTKGKQKQQNDVDQDDQDENQDDEEQDENQIPQWSPPEDALHPQH
ncbi:MAG TPA: hypothetical protein VD973_16360 [Symbiobacteriaceae bacterium]|nr:hypothetical protein [Symbiobacteriaceae bacterium]